MPRWHGLPRWPSRGSRQEEPGAPARGADRRRPRPGCIPGRPSRSPTGDRRGHRPRGRVPAQGPEPGRLLGLGRADQGPEHHRRDRLASRLPDGDHGALRVGPDRGRAGTAMARDLTAGGGPPRHRARRGVPVPGAAAGPPRRLHADLQRLGPRLRDPGPGADARPAARGQGPAGEDRGADPRPVRPPDALRVGRGRLGLLRLRRRDPAAQQRLDQLRQRRRARRLPRGEGHRRAPRPRSSTKRAIDGSDPAPQARLQLPLRPLPPLPADDGDQPAGRQPGPVAGLQPRPAALGRREGDRPGPRWNGSTA